MVKFILLILIIFLAFFILGIGFIMRFVRLFTKRPESASNRYSGNRTNNQSRGEDSYSSSEHQKIFSKDEGEYIDYEEIK